ncbi:hypothetical protein FGKAn22_06980 [Ferrigenium kumadai]|uniref:Periplasmic heavy metal sensor n=1 Tax=Ferrigenium kumadai TaxID=1682490 RepID=A0AAN1VZ86_9PROT|nr:periplasmic heavy metal sensor [Ferrigenium kumadai]BBI99005.1 hypothetical protein FGKAn22_06980 [Ferrigenium kumadai]
MNKAKQSALCLIAFTTLAYAGETTTPNQYVGQESRAIKALSADDVESYLAGKGMGLAKAAELNGYPGPSHVLALAGELNLSPAQKQQTEALFRAMEAKAKQIGGALIDEERKLDRLFASKAVTAESLTQTLRRIGELQAQVRQAHLESHLAQTEILTPEQVTTYMKLRGYGSPVKNDEHSGRGHSKG